MNDNLTVVCTRADGVVMQECSLSKFGARDLSGSQVLDCFNIGTPELARLSMYLRLAYNAQNALLGSSQYLWKPLLSQA